MAVTLGKDELLVIIAATGAAAASLTLFGRWSGRRAAHVDAIRDAAMREQQEKDQFARLKENVELHLSQTEPMMEEFRNYKFLVQQTAHNVSTLTDRVAELAEQGKSTLEEVREVAGTVRKLLSGEISFRPSRSEGGSFPPG